MQPEHDERRAFPRLIAQTPLEVAASVPEATMRRTLWGRLLDASEGGLAFATEDEVERGELFDVSVNRLDGSTALSEVRVRVVGTHDWEGDAVAHCAFLEPRHGDAWLAALNGG